MNRLSISSASNPFEALTPGVSLPPLVAEVMRRSSAQPMKLAALPQRHLLLFTMASSLRGARHRIDGDPFAWFDCVKAGVRLIPAGSEYELDVSPFERFDYLSVSLDPAWFADCVAQTDPRSRMTMPRAVLAAVPIPGLSPLLEALAVDCERRSHLPQEVADSYALLISRQLVNSASDAVGAGASIGAGVGRAIEFIEARFNEDIAIADLAVMAGVSRWALVRAFRQRTGRSPQQYLLERRLDEAELLLRCSDLSIVDIAHEIGLASQSHFGALFKRRFGCPPSAYRRTHSNDRSVVVAPAT